MFFSYDLDSQTSVNILKIIQFFSAVGTFISPIITYGYLTNFQFGLNKKFNRQTALLSIGTIIIVTPFVSFLIEQSMLIDFPEWMKKFDKDSETIVLAFLKMNNLSDLMFNLLVMAIVPAIGEELFFRGFIQNTFLGFFKNSHLAIIFTSILFSLIHFDLVGFLPRFFLGAILGYMFFISKSLWIPILAHFINNAMAVIISYPYFKSFDFVQTYNHYSESALPSTSISVALFSLISVLLLLYLMKSSSDKETVQY